jgi:hypothetical protein
LDALPDAPGLRAVRAKVHAEASSMCPTCGRRHLLDSHCSVAPEVVHHVDPPPVEASPEADALDDATTPTGSEAAPERDHGPARSRLRSVVAYLGLDAGSFGEVDDDAPGAAASSEVSRWAWSEPEDAAPATADTPYPRLRRVVTFLGFDLGADDRASATEPGQPGVAPSSITSTISTISTTSTISADEGDDDEHALVPDPPIPMTESSIDVDDEETDDEETDDEETDRVTSPDDAPRKYWRRTDDDILYRPTRRPRSPRRAWRDRIASRG